MTTFTISDYWMAAKAAGYSVASAGPSFFFIDLVKGEKHLRSWNPPEDDGDALRLAVNLELLILPCDGRRAVLVDSFSANDPVTEIHDGDPLSATRHAIFRAAIAIGRAMP